MRLGGYLRCIALTVAIATQVRGASAGDAVVLLRSEPADTQLAAVVLRLRAELESVDFKVVVDESTTVEGPSEQGPTTSIVAVVTLHRDASGGIDITVTNRVSGSTLHRHIDGASAGENATSIIALKTTEVVRASLAELTIVRPVAPAPAPAPAPPKPIPIPPPRAPVTPSSVGLSIGAAALVLNIPHGPISFAESLRVSLGLTERWAVRLSLTTQAPSVHFSTASGVASLQSQVMAFDAMARVASTQTTWLCLDGGAGVHSIMVAGQTSIPDGLALTQRRLGPIFTAGLAGGWMLADHAALVLDLQALLGVRRSDIVIVDDNVAAVGPVMLLAGLSILVRP